MEMKSEELKRRTKEFGLRVFKLVGTLPGTTEVLRRQLLRCATSVGANYRAACRARSQADFVSKIGIAEEEVDEAAYWLEFLVEADVVNGSTVASLLKEANELTAILTASEKTAKRNHKVTGSRVVEVANRQSSIVNS